jgi:hypothetical protein
MFTISRNRQINENFVAGTVSGVTEPCSPHSKQAEELRTPGKARQGKEGSRWQLPFSGS